MSPQTQQLPALKKYKVCLISENPKTAETVLGSFLKFPSTLSEAYVERDRLNTMFPNGRFMRYGVRWME